LNIENLKNQTKIFPYLSHQKISMKKIFSLFTNSPRLVRRGVRGEVLTILLLLFSLLSFTQNPYIDSLKKILASLPKPTNKLTDSTYIKTLNDLALEHRYIYPDTSITLAQQGLQISEKINWEKGKVICFRVLGYANYVKSNFTTSLEFLFKGLKIAEKISDKSLQAKLLGDIGLVYADQSDYSKALEYYFKALKIDEELNNKNGIARHLGNIGIVYTEQSDYPKALNYVFKALKMHEECGSKRNVAVSLFAIGIVYEKKGEYLNAINFYYKALKIYEELGNIVDIAEDYKKLGSLYLKLGEFNNAKEMLHNAEKLCKKTGVLKFYAETKFLLASLYDTLNSYKMATKYYKEYLVLKDSLQNTEKLKMQQKLESEYKEYKLKAEQEKLEITKKAEEKRKQLLMKGLIIFLILISTFLIFVYRSLIITKKQKAAIERTKSILEIQKKLVENKNKEIIDSINYALRIQQAILPDEKKWERLLPNSFKIYLPKDVLAGDFYWLEENENYIYVAAADCTGHGVPGAMVSVVCSSALTKAVLEDKLINTNEILDRVREIVVEKLSSNEEHLRDGMDVCLVRINKSNRKEIQYSGSNRPLYIIKANGVLEELSPDKQPIGWMEETRPFKGENKVLEQGDMLYLTTDGFADQFGGPKQKKLKTKGMIELFVNVHSLPLNEQKVKIHTYYSEWKGSGYQTDDVCVIGIKV
jgi:serine phosphatase RsbU (regulator of sigma subunit)